MRSFGILGKWSCCLVLCGTAATVAAQDRSGELQQTINVIDAQLALVARFDVTRAEERREQLAAAIEAWQVSPRGDAEFTIMQQWLSEALAAAMPGSRAAMPVLPQFARREVVPQPVPTPLPAAAQPAAEVVTPTPAAEERAAEDAMSDDAAEATPANAPEMKAPRDVARSAEPAKVDAKALWQNHAARQPIQLATSDPFVDDPVAIAEPTTRTVLRPTSFDPRSSTVPVNVAELEARILGYEQGMTSVEARLVATERLESRDLLRLARELRTLSQQRELASMYLALVDEDEQRSLPNLRDTADVKRSLLEEIGRRTHSNEQAADADLLPPSDEMLDEAAQLLSQL